MSVSRPLPLVALLLVLLFASACNTPPTERPTPDPAVTLTSKADTIAMDVYEAMGGPEAWASIPVLQFNFGFERGGEAQVARRHAWDRQTGDYRAEWSAGEDSTYVVLFNVDSQEGQAYMNGSAVDSTQNAALLQQAYGAYINDTYWLLMPIKMMDPGVTRTYAADSSDADTEVVNLAFEEVGLTPGDQYWIKVDKTTSMVEGWSMRLQNGREAMYEWTGYETMDAPAGPVTVSTRKPTPDGGFALVTDGVAVLTDVPDGLFSNPQPVLGD